MTLSDLLRTERAELVKSIAAECGFSFCGISKAGFLEDEAPRLERWLVGSKHGEMSYMANHFDMRLDPRLLVPGAKSVISLLYNYYTPLEYVDDSVPRVSMYAQGEDYHFVVKDRLKKLIYRIKEVIGDVDGRVFTDSAPVMEKAWAAKSGLGWVGKHTNLINKRQGSWFFLAEIICDLDLAEDLGAKDYCGTCTRCIDACPTDAIEAPYIVNGGKCISYFTIELKSGILPDDMKGKFENWAFGCDICQMVCPWNRFAKPHNEPRFNAGALKNLSPGEWREMTEDIFGELFRKSPLKRTGLAGMKRNLTFLGY